MTRLILPSLICVLSFSFIVSGQTGSVGVGTTTPHSSAQLDISSTTKGMLLPRMTQAERDAIVLPANGLMLYNTTTNSFQFFNGIQWTNVSHSGIISGTAGKIPKFTGPWSLSTGLMTDNGAGVSINAGVAVADASAIVDIASTTKGILAPRMTSAERMAIAAPSKGLLVFDNTTSTFWFYNGSSWMEVNGIGGGGGDNWAVLGNDIYTINTGNTGIGVSNPIDKLAVGGSVVVDQNSTNVGDFNNLLRFGGGSFATGIGSNRNSGASRYGLDFYTKGNARMRIDTSGNVSIGGSPLTAYKLYVNGDTYTSGESIISGGLAVGTTTPGFPTYMLDVNGNTRVREDLAVVGDALIDGRLSVYDNAFVQGDLSTIGSAIVGDKVTVDGGKGIVRSNNALQRVVAFPSGSVAFGNAGAGYFVDVSFGLTNVFASNPVICMGNITNATGPIERWQFTIHAVDVVAHSFLVRMYCPNGSGPVQMTLNFIAIGTAL